MEGPISFWGYKEQESNLILPEHDDDDDDDDSGDDLEGSGGLLEGLSTANTHKGLPFLESRCFR